MPWSGVPRRFCACPGLFNALYMKVIERKAGMPPMAMR